MKSLDKETALKIDKLTKDMSYLLGYKVKWYYNHYEEKIWFTQKRLLIFWTTPIFIRSNKNTYDEMLMLLIKTVERI